MKEDIPPRVVCVLLSAFLLAVSLMAFWSSHDNYTKARELHHQAVEAREAVDRDVEKYLEDHPSRATRMREWLTSPGR